MARTHKTQSEITRLSQAEASDLCARLLSGDLITRKEKVSLLAELVEGGAGVVAEPIFRMEIWNPKTERMEPYGSGAGDAEEGLNGKLNKVVQKLTSGLAAKTATEARLLKELQKLNKGTETFTLRIGMAITS